MEYLLLDEAPLTDWGELQYTQKIRPHADPIVETRKALFKISLGALCLFIILVIAAVVVAVTITITKKNDRKRQNAENADDDNDER